MENKKQRELRKQVKSDVLDIMNDFYTTQAQIDYEEQTNVYLAKREDFVYQELLKKDYIITKNTITKNGITIEKENKK